MRGRIARLAWTGWLLVFGAAAPFAQAPAQQQAAAPAAPAAAAAVKLTAYEAELKKLATKWRSARRDHEKALRNGVDASTLVDPAPAFAKQARELAARARGDAAEADALLLALDILNGDANGAMHDDCVKQAAPGLLDERLAKRIAVDWRSGLGSAVAEQRLAALAAREAPAAARASVRFALATSLLQAEVAPNTKTALPGTPAEPTTPERESRARGLLEQVRAEATGTTYAARANDLLFKYEHLAIGTPAEDFATVDENGKAWKLSDYRGKVVVVAFWGSWCGPCRAMIPHEKELVEHLKDKPFALLGINSDGEAAEVRKVVADLGITWRQAVDGSTSGPLARRWQVESWPTIYVLDAKGVIRYTDVRGKPLEDAVLALLNELEAPPK